jgi:hypothetical protein
MKLRMIGCAFVLYVSSLASTMLAQQSSVQKPPTSFISITLQDTTTGQPITNHETLSATDNFQVTVTTNNINCAGQFVVTALGASGAPPSVLVQAVPYIVGPAVGTNSVSGSTLNASVLPSGYNDWKISTTCNGAERGQFAYAHFEFYVNTN